MLKETPDGTLIPVKVIPKASRNEIVGWENNELKIRIAAVPDKGQANAELEKFLAKQLNIARSRVQVVKGLTNRHKSVKINGLKPDEFQIGGNV